jgi:hypothetical protein
MLTYALHSLSSEQNKAIEAAFLLGKRKYVRVQMGGGCCHVSVRDRTYVMIRYLNRALIEPAVRYLNRALIEAAAAVTCLFATARMS